MIELEFIQAIFPLLLVALGPIAAGVGGAAVASAIPAIAAGAAGAGIAGGIGAGVGTSLAGTAAEALPSALPSGLLSAGKAADVAIANTPGLLANRAFDPAAAALVPEMGVFEGTTLAQAPKEGIGGLLGLKSTTQGVPGSGAVPSGLTSRQAEVATGTSNALSSGDMLDLLDQGQKFTEGFAEEEEPAPPPPPPFVQAPRPDQPLTPDVLIGLLTEIRKRQLGVGPLGSGQGLGDLLGLGSQTQGIQF